LNVFFQNIICIYFTLLKCGSLVTHFQSGITVRRNMTYHNGINDQLDITFLLYESWLKHSWTQEETIHTGKGIYDKNFIC